MTAAKRPVLNKYHACFRKLGNTHLTLYPAEEIEIYILQWKQPSFDVNKGTAIEVPVGTVVSNKASIRFTGKGAANYGTVQQENLMRLLEHFADSTAPAYPTVGQLWYDTANSILSLCNSTSPITWKSLGGVQVTNIGAGAPTPAAVGDLWFQRTGSSSGILHAFTGVGRYPVSGTTIGGWSQIWPHVTMVAGREEYEAVAALVNSLIGSASIGGSEAIGKNIANLTNLPALDISLHTKFAARLPLDTNVLADSNNSELLVDPDSNDWDTLLAAAKYAVDRLEVPVGYADDISPVPFISDGRQVPASLMALNPASVAYPSLERRSGRRFGIVTLSRLYAETINVLSTAAANRYSLKGINGSSGANTTFGPTVQQVHHVQFGGGLAGAATAFVSLRFNFASTTARESFIYSGGALQITMGLTGGSTTGDTDMKALLDQRGVIRATADRTRIFANALPLSMSIAPVAPGFANALASGTTLASFSVSGASYAITASRETATSLTLIATVTSTGPMQGSLSVKFDVIKDTETYLAPALTQVYAAPAVYSAGDKQAGTAALVFQS